ncbi:MAG: family 43 glycosylhydrolase [Clostridiales bacterium]|nr:family 43 glycosylhydrolase [Clostridiales bacterium]
MKHQAVNPYLPSWEYIPDGEPHVFGDRVYVYGSHDKFNAANFCGGANGCWSPPVAALRDWRCEGIIFKKNQDPKNKLGIRLLFAPDVCQGPDGRYYLYYAYDFMGIMGVAVCDTPAGTYQFLDHVHYKDGTIWGRKKGDQFPFDPGVLVDDDGSVWLYSGFYTAIPAIVTSGIRLKNDGGTVVELERDMVTIKTDPKVIFPVRGPGSYSNHEFFEASSIRKDGDTYIFAYSSRHNHELCYATSKRPDGEFTFGGTLVSQGDLFLDGNEDERKALNYLGNTHGGMLHIGEDWYIFYHRQTNRHSYSRQACAEKLIRNPDGSFQQAEVTSCGLNGGPLRGEGQYEARIACNLWSKDGVGRYDGNGVRQKLKNHPYFTQTIPKNDQKPVQYIANMQDGAVAGFKYFDLPERSCITIEIAGSAKGVMQISDLPDFRRFAEISVATEGKIALMNDSVLEFGAGKKALYFRFCGAGALDFYSFQLETINP